MPSEQPRRVRRPKDKEELIQRLAGGGKEAVFASYRDLLIFSAALGFHHGLAHPFRSTSEPIPWSYFQNTPGEQLVDMLTAAKEHDPSALDSSAEQLDRRLTLFEEYANGGLGILSKELEASSAPPVDVIRSLILSVEQKAPSEAAEPDLKEIAERLSL